MVWVGITGPMGSGKSMVADLLRQMGYTVLDADQVAHQVLAPGTAGEAEVLKTFGQQLKNPAGVLDRRALGRLVFSDRVQLAALEKIVHPRVRAFVQSERTRLAAAGQTAVFYDVPLLFEKKMESEFDHVLVIHAQQTLRYQRLRARSRLTDAEIDERARNQLAPELKEAAASAVVVNDGTVEELRVSLLAALGKIGVMGGPLPR